MHLHARLLGAAVPLLALWLCSDASAQKLSKSITDVAQSPNLSILEQIFDLPEGQEMASMPGIVVDSTGAVLELNVKQICDNGGRVRR